MIETKLLINSTISDARKGARLLCADIKDFFLATPMPNNEYMKVQLKNFTADIISTYNLRSLATPAGDVYICIKKGMYGLKQASVLALKTYATN